MAGTGTLKRPQAPSGGEPRRATPEVSRKGGRGKYVAAGVAGLAAVTAGVLVAPQLLDGGTPPQTDQNNDPDAEVNGNAPAATVDALGSLCANEGVVAKANDLFEGVGLLATPKVVEVDVSSGITDGCTFADDSGNYSLSIVHYGASPAFDTIREIAKNPSANLAPTPVGGRTAYVDDRGSMIAAYDLGQNDGYTVFWNGPGNTSRPIPGQAQGVLDVVQALPHA